ncbi:hypothetical protein NP233_g4558 [Leucocoprinus birnbaumii]|uniref:Ketoreductase domain-containing protein n=1 Tax=Leucocoprinus birnbaumii TaxID=56174 RepID=A0AAD5YX58_9AGAR|nr:hypothetical protein NP233_g4558 [Leucocoprinus birnbaumii]
MAAQPRTVLVTGASKGIGLAVTRHLLNKFHANVVAISRSSTPELEALRSEALIHIKCDITDEAAVNSAVSTAVKTYGAIDGLVLNAGTLDPLCRIGDDTPLSAWKKHFDINFFSLVIAIKATLPHLRKSPGRGKIVFVSSGAAVGGTAAWGPYNAGKAAMNSLCRYYSPLAPSSTSILLFNCLLVSTRTLSNEEPDVVSVALRPGMVDTNMQETLRQIGATNMLPADHEKFVRVHADGKLVKPEDCGHVIAALAMDAPKELSGSFVNWDSEECKPFRQI